MHTVVEGVVKASVMMSPTLHRIKKRKTRKQNSNYQPTVPRKGKSHFIEKERVMPLGK